MRRWVCPNCDSAVNAPDRPRKNDVRRYCLKCSASSGVLVERAAPALERKRAQAKTAQREKAQIKAERKREKNIITMVDAVGQHHAINVRRELRRALKDCGFFSGWAYGQRPTMDDVDLSIRRGLKPYSTGRVYGSFQVVFTFAKEGSYEEALELIYHEAGHMASPIGEGHGPKFRRILADGLQRRWSFIRYGSVERGACYGVDKKVVEQMRDHVRNGGQL